MKNKVIVLIIASILTIGGFSAAYAASRNDTSFNNYSRSMMNGSMMGRQNGVIQSNDSFNNMIKIMNDNGFNNQANAMANRNFDAMNKLMTNISDSDYEKMINVMQQNGYAPMANMMKSVNREDMTKIHQSMMGR